MKAPTLYSMRRITVPADPSATPRQTFARAVRPVIAAPDTGGG